MLVNFTKCIISTELKNETTREQQLYLTSKQGSRNPVCLCSVLIGWYISLSGGLKGGGLIKVDYRGREGDSVLASQSGHHSNGFTMETLLHPPPLCPRPSSAVVYLPRPTTCWQVGKETEMFYRDTWGCCFFYVSWLSNLWLLTRSAPRLLMCFHCVPHQDLWAISLIVLVL